MYICYTTLLHLSSFIIISVLRQRQCEVLINITAKSPFLKQEKSQVKDRSKGRRKRSRKGAGKTSKVGSEGGQTVRML